MSEPLPAERNTDRYNRWAAGILAFVVFLFFLADIVEFIAWKYHHVITPLLAHK